MDKNRIEGSARQAAGSIKESLGRLTGNRKMQIEGHARKLAGKAQKTYGNLKDQVLRFSH